MTKAKEKAFNQALLVDMRAAADVAPIDLAKAKELAAKHGEKWRSVVAKAVKDGIRYENKPRVRKDGKPIASKETTVATIEIATGVADGFYDGLQKATKPALERLRDRLAELLPEDEEPEADSEEAE